MAAKTTQRYKQNLLIELITNLLWPPLNNTKKMTQQMRIHTICRVEVEDNVKVTATVNSHCVEQLKADPP
jgi:hypothetical protein